MGAGGHGGVLGAAGHAGGPLLHYVPTLRHSYLSEVNIPRLPSQVTGVRRGARGLETVTVPIKGADGWLLESAIPQVMTTKDATYSSDDANLAIAPEADLIAMIYFMSKNTPPAASSPKGLPPYATITSHP